MWAMTMRRILGNSSESRGQSIVYISAPRSPNRPTQVKTVITFLGI